MMKIPIHTEFITLQQALKLGDVIASGGMVKSFLQDENVFVNGSRVKERGKKLYPGDVVAVNGLQIVITRSNHDNN